MALGILVLGGVLIVLTALALLHDRRADRTVVERMAAPDRPDGGRDPRAYIHHSTG